MKETNMTWKDKMSRESRVAYIQKQEVLSVAAQLKTLTALALT